MEILLVLFFCSLGLFGVLFSIYLWRVITGSKSSSRGQTFDFSKIPNTGFFGRKKR